MLPHPTALTVRDLWTRFFPLWGSLVGGGVCLWLVDVPQLTLFMDTQKETGLQYPPHEGSIITGDPARGMAAQGATGGYATCDPAQAVGAPGSLGSRVIGSHPPSAAKLSTAGTSRSRSRGSSKERRRVCRGAEQAAKRR